MDQTDNVTYSTDLTTLMNQETVVIDDSEENSNSSILYITFAIIFALLSLWIIVIVFTKDDHVTILNDMLDANAQTKLAIDIVPL